MGFTPSNGEELQSEYLVPREHAVAAIRAVRGLAAEIAPLLFVSEVRTVAADTLWLSPAFGRDVVGLHFTWRPAQPEVLALLPRLEAALAGLEARPHWGKLFAADAAALAPRYPRFEAFTALAAEYDPSGPVPERVHRARALRRLTTRASLRTRRPSGSARRRPRKRRNFRRSAGASAARHAVAPASDLQAY